MAAIPSNASVVVLTGAGISVASGLAPFRGPGGLWNDIDVERSLSAQAWRSQPANVLSFLEQMRAIARRAQPNEAHLSLARAEAQRTNGARFDVITQNIDGLHGRAGSKQVHEIHGSLEIDRCEKCDRHHPHGTPQCDCGGEIRPHVVLFGEMLPTRALAASQRAVSRTQYFIAVGTSGVVWPAASFVLLAKDAGAHCINVNIEPCTNQAFDEELVGPAEKILPELFGV